MSRRCMTQFPCLPRPRSISMQQLHFMVLMAFGLGLAQGQGDLDARLKDLNTTNDLTEESSYRCGVFFAGRKGAKPRQKIYIIPKRFPADCSKPDPDLYEKECFDLFNSFRGVLTWETTSKVRGAPYTIGDDLCQLVRKEHGITEIPNGKIKRGLKIGFYFNYCTDPQWLDTELRDPVRVCCDKDSRYQKCSKPSRNKDDEDDD